MVTKLAELAIVVSLLTLSQRLAGYENRPLGYLLLAVAVIAAVLWLGELIRDWPSKRGDSTQTPPRTVSKTRKIVTVIAGATLVGFVSYPWLIGSETGTARKVTNIPTQSPKEPAQQAQQPPVVASDQDTDEALTRDALDFYEEGHIVQAKWVGPPKRYDDAPAAEHVRWNALYQTKGIPLIKRFAARGFQDERLNMYLSARTPSDTYSAMMDIPYAIHVLRDRLIAAHHLTPTGMYVSGVVHGNFDGTTVIGGKACLVPTKIYIPKKDFQRCGTRSARGFKKSTQIEPASVNSMGGYYTAGTQRVDLLD